MVFSSDLVSWYPDLTRLCLRNRTEVSPDPKAHFIVRFQWPPMIGFPFPAQHVNKHVLLFHSAHSNLRLGWHPFWFTPVSLGLHGVFLEFEDEGRKLFWAMCEHGYLVLNTLSGVESSQGFHDATGHDLNDMQMTINKWQMYPESIFLLFIRPYSTRNVLIRIFDHKQMKSIQILMSNSNVSSWMHSHLYGWLYSRLLSWFLNQYLCVDNVMTFLVFTVAYV